MTYEIPQMTILERAARAICQTRYLDGGVNDCGWDSATPAMRAEYMA